MAQVGRETLKPSYLYLDSTLSFHQMFSSKYMTGIKKVSTSLRGKCNGGVSYSDEKGDVLHLFNTWLVRTGIANLLSLPSLERDGFVVSYNTKTSWMVECPDGTVLKFLKDTGVCAGFPYLSTST